MTYSVYILYSDSLDQYYIGQTKDLSIRIEQHRMGRSSSTKRASDWIVVYKEEFETRADAMRREKFIKNKKSRNYLEWLISS